MKLTTYEFPIAHMITSPRRGEVHVWKISLDCEPVPGEIDTSILNRDEQGRMDRIGNHQARERFALAHVALRQILARYLRCGPRDVPILAPPGEKPRLCPSADPSDLRFNLSHSHGQALLAIATGCEVGIDLEPMHQPEEIASLSRRCFGPRRAARILALPKEPQTRLFLRQWTRHEAAAKATGLGLLAMEFADKPRPMIRARRIEVSPGWIAAVSVVH